MHNSAWHPDIVVIGQQRSATTALHNMLSTISSISLPSLKETHFFSRRYHYGFKWYKSLFNLNKKVAMEICPSYLCSMSALSRLHYISTVSNKTINIVVITRDSDAALKSLLNYRYKRGQIRQPSQVSMLSETIYAQELIFQGALKAWEVYFPRITLLPYPADGDFSSIINSISRLAGINLGHISSPSTKINHYGYPFITRCVRPYLLPIKELAIRFFPHYI